MRPQDCTFEALFRGPHSALLEPQICIGGAHGGAPRLHFWSPTVFPINTLPAVPASPVWRSGNQALRHLHRPYTTGWRRRCSRRSPSCKVPGILHPSQFSQQDIKSSRRMLSLVMLTAHAPPLLFSGGAWIGSGGSSPRRKLQCGSGGSACQ